MIIPKHKPIDVFRDTFIGETQASSSNGQRGRLMNRQTVSFGEFNLTMLH